MIYSHLAENIAFIARSVADENGYVEISPISQGVMIKKSILRDLLKTDDLQREMRKRGITYVICNYDRIRIHTFSSPPMWSHPK